MAYHVYIITNSRRTTLYIGVTGDLFDRTYRHKKRLHDGFSKRYNLDRLVYFEKFELIEDAIKREKRLKRWRREWKVELIRSKNPKFDDLAAEWYRHVDE